MVFASNITTAVIIDHLPLVILQLLLLPSQSLSMVALARAGTIAITNIVTKISHVLCPITEPVPDTAAE